MDFLDEVERENPSPVPTEVKATAFTLIWCVRYSEYFAYYQLSRKSMAFEEDTQKE